MIVTPVLDASALVAFARDEPGGVLVADLFASSARRPLIHALTLCAVEYVLTRREGSTTAARILADIDQLGIDVRDDLDRSFRALVVEVKERVPAASLADGFVIALAARVAGTVVTADRPGFPAAVLGDLCAVHLIR